METLRIDGGVQSAKASLYPSGSPVKHGLFTASGHNSTPSSVVDEDLAGIKDAPIFYPTEEEFKHPLKYIAKIRPIAEPCGMCKIIPPASFRPPFAINKKTFRFKTRLQAINELRERTSGQGQQAFRESYGRFLAERELLNPTAPALGWPCYENGEDVDLCMLYHAVKRRGGRDFVEATDKWREVGTLVFGQRTLAGSLASNARHLYNKYLLEYELWIANGKKLEVKAMPKARGRIKRETFKVDKEVDPSVYDKQVCEKCLLGCHGEVMVLCDRCDKGYHLYCLLPPLENIPEGTWFCPECVCSSQDSFGFLEGKEYDLSEFAAMANRFKADWFGGASKAAAVAPDEMEREFWTIIARPSQPVLVAYGADLDTAVYGSGFPSSSSCPKYGKHPWNVNNFPKFDGSLLKNVDDQIPGVMVPWLYIGMLFSSFCWHHEDHNFYSVNYHHWGDVKTWYGVPGSEAEAFEKVMRSAVPELFELQHDLLFQLVTMLPPGEFRRSGVPIYKLHQSAGEFVITFPRAYHAGFNQGLNCAEAVNFAPGDWLPYGALSIERYRKFHKNAIISHEEIVCVAAQNPVWPEAVPWLSSELKRMLAIERQARQKLWLQGTRKATRLPLHKEPDRISSEEDPPCVVCRFHLYFSSVQCSCSPQSLVCLDHADRLCDCKPANRTLLYRFSILDLERLVEKVLEAGVGSNLATKASGENQVRCTSGKDASTADVVTKDIACPSMAVKQENDGIDGVDGKAYGWHRAALKWVRKAEDALSSTVELKALEELVASAEEFLWGGSEVAKVHDLVIKLRAAISWGHSVARFDPAGASVAGLYNSGSYSRGEFPRKPPIDLLQELLSRPGPPPVKCHFYGYLKEIYAKHVALDKKMSSMLAEATELDAKTVASSIPDLSKLPLEIPTARKLRQLVNASQAWADSVRKILPMAKSSRIRPQSELPMLERLLELKAESKKLPKRLMELQALEGAIERALAWRKKTLKVCGDRWQECAIRGREVPLWPGNPDAPASLQKVEGLLEEIVQLPVRMPETAVLQGHVDAVRVWVKEAESALVAKADLRELNEILRKGTSNCARAAVPEYEELRRMILVRQWMDVVDRAEKSPSGKLSRSRITELIKGGEGLPPKSAKPRLALAVINEEPLIAELRSKLSAADSFKVRAQKVLCAAPGAVSTEVYQSLVREAKALPVSLDEAMKLSEELLRAQSWAQRVQPFLHKHSMRQGITGEQTNIPPAQQRTELEQLIKELRTLRPALKEADPAKALLNQARLWGEVAMDLAQKIDAAGVVGLSNPKGATSCTLIAHIKRVEELFHQADEMGVQMPEYKILQERYRVLLWQQRALEVLGILTPTRLYKLEEIEACIANAPSSHKGATEEMRSALQKLATTVRMWNAHAAAVLAGEGADSLPGRRKTRKSAADALGGAVDGGAHVSNGGGSERESADGIDRSGKGQLVSEFELGNLIIEGQRLAVDLPDLPRLHQMLGQHRAWVKRALVLQTSALPSYADVLKLRAEAENVMCEERKWLDEACGRVVVWEEACRRNIVKGRTHPLSTTGGNNSVNQKLVNCQRSSPSTAGADATLEDTLEDILVGLCVALNRAASYCDIDMHALVARMESGMAAFRLQRAIQAASRQAVRVHYCVCQVADKEAFGSMVGCDSCPDWYHMKCVGMSQQEALDAARYICPFCTTASGEPFTLIEPSSFRGRKTRRPPIAILLQLLEDARRLPCVVGEAVLLEAIVKGSSLLATFFRQYIELSATDPFWVPPHQTSGGPAVGLPTNLGVLKDITWFGNLSQLAKISFAIEVGLEEVGSLISLMNSFKWRRRAAKQLAGNPTMRCLADLRRDGSRDPGIVPRDSLFIEIVEREKAGRTWSAHARQVCVDKGQTPLPQVEELLRTGEALPVNLEKELEMLRERCQLHCICRLPYDESRGMVACDKCDIWYHFDCLGLTEEAIRQSSASQGGAEFVCPECLPRFPIVKHEPADLGPSCSTPVDTSTTPKSGDVGEFGNQEPRIFDLDLNQSDEAVQEASNSTSSCNECVESDNNDQVCCGSKRRRTPESSSVEPSLSEGEKRARQREETNDGQALMCTPSGRPCRKTAGKNSLLNDFVVESLGARCSRRLSA